MDIVPNGGSIIFLPGTFSTSNGVCSATISSSKSVSMHSFSQVPSTVIISCSNAIPLEIAFPSLTLSGMTFSGSAVVDNSSHTSLIDSVFQNSNGQSAYTFNGGQMTITSCAFSGNSAPSGAALNLPNAACSFYSDVLFTNNVATVAGGAIYTSHVLLFSNGANVQFISNSAPKGGAIYMTSGGFEAFAGSNLTFTSNTGSAFYATYSGGSFKPGSTASFISNTGSSKEIQTQKKSHKRISVLKIKMEEQFISNTFCSNLME